MILYKYMSFETAKKVLNNHSLWFSAASTLNDAFETSAGIGHVRFDGLLGEMSRSMITEDRYRILCLTRDPLSPIMWAHYGEQNNGVVIGVDSEIAALHDEVKCALPAQYGNMIYTRTKPNFPYGNKDHLPPGFPKHDNYDPKDFEFLQRNFLYKSSEWHYEEEVRILKTSRSLLIDNPSQIDMDIGCIPPSGMEFIIPVEAIKEIYLGARFYFSRSYEDLKIVFESIRHCAPNAAIFDAYRDPNSWHMTSKEIKDWRLHLEEIFPRD